MTAYRVIVHYVVKKGREAEAAKFMEEILLSAADRGAHDLEWLEESPIHYITTGIWDDLKDAEAFQRIWNEKWGRVGDLFSPLPVREIYKIRNRYADGKSRKTA